MLAIAIVASLLLAAGCWFRPEWRWLLVVTAFAMAAFAVLDLREVIHQLGESDAGLASVAGAVATLHVAAAVTAVIVSRRVSGRLPRPERVRFRAPSGPRVYSPRWPC